MLNRTLQRLVAKIGIGAVLFAQLCVAAYACPELTALAENTPFAMSTVQPSAMPAGCEIPHSHNANLCQQHCQIGTQSVAGAEHVSIPMPATLPLTVVELLQPASALKLATLSVLRERETGPPPLVRFHFFRI